MILPVDEVEVEDWEGPPTAPPVDEDVDEVEDKWSVDVKGLIDGRTPPSLLLPAESTKPGGRKSSTSAASGLDMIEAP